MFRKIASLSVALIVAGGVMVAVPVHAAAKVSNGVACTKSGSTTKVSGVTYKCAKNPLVTTSSKLTWLTVDCLTTANAAVKAQKAAAATSAQFKAQIPVIDLGITTEIANRAEVQVKLDAATLRLTGAEAKLAAAKTERGCCRMVLVGTSRYSWLRKHRLRARVASCEQRLVGPACAIKAN